MDPCIYPYRALRYDGTVVLFTLAGVPGRACHGCSAVVSAVFLEQGRRGLRSVGFHEDFIETGTYGALNAIRPARFGSQNGAVIESGGTFQGISYDIIHPFVFEDEQMKAVGPEEGIPIKSSDCGATESGEPCRNIRGSWRTEGRRLLVRYTGRRGDRTRIDETVVYELRNDELVLISGADVAAEMRDYRP